MFLRLNKKGQSIAEYALVLGLVTATVIGVQVYIRTNYQSKVRQVVDIVGINDGDTGITNPYITLTNPTLDAKTATIGTVSSWSKTPQKSKSLVDTELKPRGEAEIITEEVSEVKGGERKTLY